MENENPHQQAIITAFDPWKSFSQKKTDEAEINVGTPLPPFSDPADAADLALDMEERDEEDGQLVIAVKPQELA